MNRELFLIGHLQPEISGEKLPSNREVLSVFCYHSPDKKENTVNSVCSQIKNYWNKTGIPTSRDQYIKNKILALYKKWKRLLKSSNKIKKSEKEESKIRDFSAELDNLFDIAHKNALKLLKKSPIQKRFLLSQRKKGREGSLFEVIAIAEAKN